MEQVLKVSEAGEDEYAEDPARPGELWTPKCLTEDMPVGKVLRLDPDALPKRKKAKNNDRDDRGTGDSVSAG